MEAYETDVMEPVSQTGSRIDPADRPIYLALAGGAMASAAMVPLMLAVFGPVPMINLLWVSALAGFLLAVGVLFALAMVKHVSKAVDAVKAFTGRSSDRSEDQTPSMPGQLAFD